MSANKMPYCVFSVLLEQYYSFPLSKGESFDDRCLAIDYLIDRNGWSWDLIIEEMMMQK
jgi:hypothetical protein